MFSNCGNIDDTEVNDDTNEATVTAISQSYNCDMLSAIHDDNSTTNNNDRNVEKMIERT